VTTRFNLVEDPWLPVLGQSGPQLVSIRTALRDSRTIREFDGLGPLESVATLRLLVAILVDTLRWETTAEWGEAWALGHFDATRVDAYLGRHAQRFDLFDDADPFYQVATLEPINSTGVKPVALVMPEVASGNNTPLFSSLVDDRVPPLSGGQAAIRLITLQGFDTAGIKTGVKGDPATVAGKTTGNPTGPLGGLGVVMAMGRNLFETLMLNYPLGPIATDDRPAWLRSIGPSWKRRPAVGILDLLTWQSRRVRLIVNGSGLVDRVIVAAGDRLDHTPLFEPHTLFRQAKDGPVAQRPARHQVGRTPWRGLTSLLTLAPSAERTSTSNCLIQLGDLEYDGLLDQHYPLDVLSVGVVYGNMSAVVEDVISERIPVPVVALVAEQGRYVRDMLFEVALAGDQVMNALNHLDGDLRRARGGDPIPWDGGERLGDVFAAAMAGPTRQLLRALQEGRTSPDPLTEWELAARRIARGIADPVLENAPEQTFLGVGEGPQRINQAKAAVFFLAALKKTLVRATKHDNPEETA
jgi:CRISPR system Cascade subunit CasA